MQTLVLTEEFDGTPRRTVEIPWKDGAVYTIGRSPECTYQIGLCFGESVVGHSRRYNLSLNISRIQATLRLQGGTCTVSDGGVIRVNGRPQQKPSESGLTSADGKTLRGVVELPPGRHLYLYRVGLIAIRLDHPLDQPRDQEAFGDDTMASQQIIEILSEVTAAREEITTLRTQIDSQFAAGMARDREHSNQLKWARRAIYLLLFSTACTMYLVVRLGGKSTGKLEEALWAFAPMLGASILALLTTALKTNQDS